jgi:hypothetical protein
MYTKEFSPMSCYIVCHRKSSNPRVDVRICQKTCKAREDCKGYITYTTCVDQHKVPGPAADKSPSLGLG